MRSRGKIRTSGHRNLHRGVGEAAWPQRAAATGLNGRSDPSRIIRTFRTAVFAATLGGVVALLGAAGAATGAPGLAPNEPATAVAGRTTVYLEATYTGYVRYAEPGRAIRREPVVVRRSCSGAIVNPIGYAVTASGCVRPDEQELLADAVYALGRTLIEAERLTADRLTAFVERIGRAAQFSGPRPGTKPSSTLYGQLGVARPGLTSAPAIPATIERADPAADGNVALVKLARSGLPAIEIDASEGSGPRAEVVVLGYGSAEPDAEAAGYAVRARAVGVTRRTGISRLSGTDDLGAGSRGGPVVDAEGRLLAILDNAPAVAGGPVRQLVPATRVTGLLTQAGVTNELSGLDRAYRDGLDAYFAGQFSTAVRRFDALLRLAPSHGAAQTYRERAQHRLDVDGDATENSADWLRYLLSAAAGALVIVAAGRGWRQLSRSSRMTRLTARIRRWHSDADTSGLGKPPGSPAPVRSEVAPEAVAESPRESPDESPASATAVAAPQGPVTVGNGQDGGCRQSPNPTGLAPR